VDSKVTVVFTFVYHRIKRSFPNSYGRIIVTKEIFFTIKLNIQ